MNLSLARNSGRARFRVRVLDFEVSGCARSLRRSLRRAAAYAPREAIASLEGAYRECADALLYWHEGVEARPLEAVIEHLASQRERSPRPLSMPELRTAMRHAREWALEAYPAWRWPERVVGALTLAYLLWALLRHCAANRRMDGDDPVTRTYRKLIENRSAWMPGCNTGELRP